MSETTRFVACQLFYSALQTILTTREAFEERDTDKCVGGEEVWPPVAVAFGEMTIVSGAKNVPSSTAPLADKIISESWLVTLTRGDCELSYDAGRALMFRMVKSGTRIMQLQPGFS